MKKTKHAWTPLFPAKENPNIEKAFFDWPILLQYDFDAILRKFCGHEVFSVVRSLNQPKGRCVCILSMNQSNRFSSVRLLFCFVRAFSFQGHTKISLTIGIRTPSSFDKESGIQYLEFGIHSVESRIKEERPLDPWTRTTTSTRFHLKFFRVFSNYRLPGKFQFNNFSPGKLALLPLVK